VVKNQNKTELNQLKNVESRFIVPEKIKPETKTLNKTKICNTTKHSSTKSTEFLFKGSLGLSKPQIMPTSSNRLSIGQSSLTSKAMLITPAKPKVQHQRNASKNSKLSSKSRGTSSTRKQTQLSTGIYTATKSNYKENIKIYNKACPASPKLVNKVRVN
jgi:hypothetical protein